MCQKAISQLSKQYSFHKEKPEEFLDETDVDSFCKNIIFEIFQSQHRLNRVSKKLRQKVFCYQIAPVLQFDDKAALYLSRSE